MGYEISLQQKRGALEQFKNPEGQKSSLDIFYKPISGFITLEKTLRDAVS